jgi:flavin-dependent dehydrogenase
MARRIAIVGGGPAGSAMAIALINRGVDPTDVVIIDKARFPRPKLCGGGVTFRGTEALSALLGSELPGGLRTRAIQFRSGIGELEIVERGVQCIYDRGLLDAALLSVAKERGVEVREEENVSAIEPASDGWTVRTGRRAETYAWVAGADGACGISRRASGLPGGITGRLVEAVYEPIDTAPDPSRLYFDFDPVARGIPGYAWIFPYPSPDGATDRWKIGIMDGRGRVPGSELRRYTERFAERHGFRLADDKIAGWPERYFDTRARGHRPGLLLVGEAYGIDPLLGEGIAPALFHAQYAATRLKMALDAGTKRIASYERGFLCTPEGRNLRFQMHLADLIYGSSGARWLRVLFDLPRLRALAESGTEAYGRLAQHMPPLIGSYLWHVLRRGLPPAEPPTQCSIAP